MLIQLEFQLAMLVAEIGFDHFACTLERFIDPMNLDVAL
jgi:ABC-type uncharacterized transport system ATPase subunit